MKNEFEKESELWNLFVFSMEKLGYEVQFPVKKKKSALLESKRIMFPNNSKEFIKKQDIRIFKYIKKKK